MNNWIIRRADWEEDRDGIKAVRQKVFVEEQSVPEALEWDGLDEAALQLLAINAEDAPIGTVRLRLLDQYGQIGRMAVLEKWRGKGIGSALLKEALRLAEEEELSSVFVHAQTRLISFYDSFGFIPAGPEFTEAGIPHQKMIKTIN